MKCLFLLAHLLGLTACTNPHKQVHDVTSISTFSDVKPDENVFLINSNNLTAWTPVSATLEAPSTNFYQFDLDATDITASNHLKLLIFLTGNLVSFPGDDQSVMKVYYSFNESIYHNDLSGFPYFEFSLGYLQGLVPLVPSVETIYLAVYAPGTGSWEYNLGISENDLLYQWDSDPWLDLVDTDYDSALFRTGNLTNSGAENNNLTEDAYDIYIYDSQDYFEAVYHSLSAIQNGPYLCSSVNQLGSINILKSIYNDEGISREQFLVTGLNSSTTYYAYLTKKVKNEHGGIIFNATLFTTQNSTACSLVFDLEFCDDVAYAVPSPGNTLNKTAIGLMYDVYAQEAYTNFTYALDQVACDTEADAIFSPLKTCKDCARSYKNWLCAVGIPRCSTTDRKPYKLRDRADNRNDHINSVVQPRSNYYEVLPCYDMCLALVTNCPSYFNFACPAEGSDLMFQSYQKFSNNVEYDTCNIVGDYPLVVY